MPAMSPTMTEGGIVAWKMKAGDSFSSGDVLLEVETDKATIDVEAVDDGVMMEILLNDGAAGIPVGQPIAWLAEPGDDLATLTKPALDEAPAAVKEEAVEEPKKEEPKKEETKIAAPPKEAKKAATPSATTRDSVFGPANPDQKFMPSVELLLHANHISSEDAYSKIPASGPKGRLLKGDVLAYLGVIDASAVVKVTEYIKSKEHLDLSNIKIAPPAEAKKEAKKAEKPKPTNILSVEFTSELGEGISKEKFQYAFERAVESAIKQTYGARFPQFARAPSPLPLVEDIFDDLLVAPVTKSRFEVYDISYKYVGLGSSFYAPVDDFDALLGLAPEPTASSALFEADSVSAIVDFKIKFDQTLSDSTDFVDFFQDSLLSQIPSKQLIISK